MDGLHSLLYTLVIGDYLFTAWVFRYFNARLERMVQNELAHLREQLAQLESKVNGQLP